MSSFSLTLFCTDPGFIREAVAAGVDSIIVDWERIGKAERQAGADTQVGQDTLSDLERVRASTRARLICRINQWNPGTTEELAQAIGAGADEVLVPMVRSAAEVQAIIDSAHGRCGVGILVETVDALGELDLLGRLPLSRVYVGLNDLAIEQHRTNIFTPLADGTLQRIRQAFHVPFGFGGLTLPQLGHPIPCRLLIGDMARLDCSFSFLRRSFHRDVRLEDIGTAIPAILNALEEACRRSPEQIAEDRRELARVIETWPNGISTGGRTRSND